MGKKYLIYVDILGYKGKAEEIAKISGFEESVCRENYLRTPLKKKIEDITTTKFQGISEIEGSDNYLIIVDTVEEVIEIVGEITRIRIPHNAFQWIPLEIGVGTKMIKEDFPVDPFSRTEVIDFLKEDIINPYRDYFKQKYKKSVRETFVLFTKDFYNDLEPLDKGHCTPISYQGKSFFLGKLEEIHERCRIYEFLRKIEYPGSRLYGRIDEVYVPPAEYKDIQNTLKEKRIVIITGTQEYGKTYTAVRLLWEYFCNGYEVLWVKGGGEREREEVRKWLEDIGAKVRPHRIVYFEDPFGRMRYEKRDYLEKEIGTIIKSAINVEDSYMIITSREEVFKEFEKNKLAAVEIKEFEIKLNLMRPSYDYEKRKEIVTKWAEEQNCVWVNNTRLKTIVFEEIEDEKKLTTPLKMRGFAVATVEVHEEDLLKEKIMKKSEETAKAFAEEIRNMTWDKIVFLSLLFVSDYPVDFMRSIYEEMVEELCLVDALDFDDVLHWFRDDKVHVGYNVWFSHPSYSETLKYLISGNDPFKRRYREVFGRNLLSKITEKDETAKGVAFTVAEHFDKLPENVRNLLFTLAEKDKTAGDVAFTVAEHFDKLPENVRNTLLLTLAEKDETAWSIARAVAEHFDKLPENVRNTLLLTLAEKDKTAGDVTFTVAEHFDKLPENVRNLLFTLAKKNEAIRSVVWGVAQNFNRLPNEVRNLLFTLAKEDKNARVIALVVAENFNRLPNEVRNLLFTLAGKDKAAKGVAFAVSAFFDFLPEDVRNKLLLKLGEKDKAAWHIIRTIVEHFDELPEDVRNLLFTLAEKNEGARGVAEILTNYSYDLPEDVRSELLSKSAVKCCLSQVMRTGGITLVTGGKYYILVDGKYVEITDPDWELGDLPPPQPESL